MTKLIEGNYYKIKDYNKPLKFIDIIKMNYICDYCNTDHYNKVLPNLYFFEITKNNYTKYGTSCIKKVLL